MCSRSKLWKHVDTTQLFTDTDASALQNISNSAKHANLLTKWACIRSVSKHKTLVIIMAEFFLKNFADHFRTNPTYISSEKNDYCLSYLGCFYKRGSRTFQTSFASAGAIIVDQSIAIELNADSIGLADVKNFKHAGTLPRSVAAASERRSSASLPLEDDNKEAQHNEDAADVAQPIDMPPIKRKLLELDERRLKAQNIIAWLSEECASALTRNST